ncbi:hypothetical protein KP509_05G060800 [Ceratopteris richardii]|uniref:3-hydroxyisobutyryl-CoA hydrolase n=1 Tax=Ceratopteris richardii TaxID=49495 RepID=A0A8T2UM40_CERRI|nr:hypothetical protein KP509_05G060800 [Ceratopteris richardii]
MFSCNSVYVAARSLSCRATMALEVVQALVSDNGLGIITLDRPKALNAMNLEMDSLYKSYLEGWGKSEKVKAILVQSSSPRAFSAGMDIKSVAAAIKDDKKTTLVSKVFDAEYTLICQIARLKKPYISLMDGITMGFGIGLSCHGTFRIVTERTVLAMPENGIGLFPDIGFAHIAARSPGNGAVGAYLALTGARINNPADALFSGIGTHFVPSENLTLLKEALLHTDFSSDAYGAVHSVLSQFTSSVDSEASLKRLLPSIVSCFGGGKSVMESIAALKKEQMSSDPKVSEWATGALTGLAKGAPFSLCITQQHFHAVAAAACNMDNELQEIKQIEGVMKMEYRLALRTAIRDDFIEGVRAVVIDKDQNPKWKPANLEDVDANGVIECFESLAESEELKI